MKTSIIVQGPANMVSISNLCTYQKFGEVILVCYDTCDLEQYMPLIPVGTKVITLQIPDYPAFNACNLFYQVMTTLAGLYEATGDFTIKTRSDEKYTDLYPFIRTMEENPDKFVSNNIFFKGHREPLHPSDHMFGGKTEHMVKAMNYLYKICLENPNPNHPIHQDRYLTGEIFGTDALEVFNSEVAIFLSFLHAIEFKVTKENRDEALLENSVLINIKSLGDYIYSFSIHGQRYYFNTPEPLYDQDELKSLEKLNQYYVR